MPANVKINELPSGNFNAKVFDYTDINKKRHYKSITAPSKREVKKLIAEFLAERDNRRASISDMTVGDAIDKYIEIKSNILSPATIREYKRSRSKDLQGIMNISLNKLTPQDVQIEINVEAMTHSPKSVRNMHGLLASALSVYAPELKLKTKLPQKVKPTIEIPTKQEITNLLEAIKGKEIELPIYLAALCGLRRSEIAALKWSDIDFEKGLLTVQRALVKNENKQYVIKGTKTTAGKRIIRIFAPVLEVMKRTEQKGEYITRLNPEQMYKRYVNVLKEKELKHYRFHDLRHYTVSVMLSLNIPKNYIADYMGHESERMIDEVYGHIMHEAKQTFEEKVDKYYENIFNEA